MMALYLYRYKKMKKNIDNLLGLKYDIGTKEGRNRMLTRLGTDYFEQIYRLLQESFPEDEYRTDKEQKELFGRKEYRVYGKVMEESGQLQAFISLWQFEQFAFIEHFAVNPDFRNRGIGELIIHKIVRMLSMPVCLEVELPDNELAKRRIGFYSRNGFYLNEYSYIQPPISKGRKPLPLRIMTYGGTVTKEEFHNIKEVLYHRVYGV